jgi:hypothetical protein
MKMSIVVSYTGFENENYCTYISVEVSLGISMLSFFIPMISEEVLQVNFS